MAQILTSEEQKRVDLYTRELKNEWENAEQLKQYNAERKGETYTPQPFAGVKQEDALAAVRAGWKSKLDRMFEKKFRREGIKK